MTGLGIGVWGGHFVYYRLPCLNKIPLGRFSYGFDILIGKGFDFVSPV